MPREVGRSDVLVIGAGPAGAAAAAVLAQSGIDVTLVDRARFPRDKTCGDAISNNGVKLLDALGAGDAVRAMPHALVRSGAALFPDGAYVARNYDEPGLIVPRLQLDDCIRVAALRAGTRWLEGVRVERLLREGDAICGAEGPGFQHRAPIVIAADGHASVALAALGRSTPRGSKLGLSTTLYARNTRHPLGDDVAEHFFEHDLPCGYAWLFPAVEGIANLGVYLTQDMYRRDAPLSQLLERFIARHPDRFAAIEAVGKPRTWSLPLAPPPWSVSAKGLLLAGDAGNFIDPFTGEGIWQALFTGMAAARAAIAALRGSGVLDATHCARYEEECERTIGRPSRGKRVAQQVMRRLIDLQLYRLPPVRSGLRWLYARRSFEMTKA